MPLLDDWDLKALWHLHREWMDDDRAFLFGISEDELEKLRGMGLAQKRSGKWGPTAKGSSFVEQSKKAIEERIKGF